MPGSNILLVEADGPGAALISAALTVAGHEVTVVDGRPAALAAAPDHDLILIDILPGPSAAAELVLERRDDFTGRIDRLAERLHHQLGLTLPMGTLDVSFYRDDFAEKGLHPQVRPSHIPFEVEGRPLILVDDVLFTGRTIRAAFDALLEFGRPSSIQLAVLVDRGHRELPIKADYVGKNVPTALTESVQVQLTETDGVDAVEVLA